jgi:hypothetical protein
MQPTRVGADEARELFNTGAAVFVDARNQSDWLGSDSQVPGAFRVAPDGGYDAVPRGRTVITYCS